MLELKPNTMNKNIKIRIIMQYRKHKAIDEICIFYNLKYGIDANDIYALIHSYIELQKHALNGATSLETFTKFIDNE